MNGEGVKIRAQIDTESVRNVILVNGGGSVALLALLPAILGTPLVAAILTTLAIWLGGLTLAVIHSVLRRKCSLIYEQNGMKPVTGTPRLGIQLREPWVCWWSWKCLYLSILAFLVGGIVLVAIAFANLDVLTQERDAGHGGPKKVNVLQNNALQSATRSLCGLASVDLNH